MKRILISQRYFVSTAKNIENVEKLDFMKLCHHSKIPDQPVKEVLTYFNQEIEIDKRTIQLLERLALVNLDGEEALKTLKSSIQFAKRIENFNVKGKKPLYTVLEDQPLYLRTDRVIEGNCREEILKNSKVTEEDYFISPPGNIPLKQEGTNANY